MLACGKDEHIPKSQRHLLEAGSHGFATEGAGEVGRKIVVVLHFYVLIIVAAICPLRGTSAFQFAFEFLVALMLLRSRSVQGALFRSSRSEV